LIAAALLIPARAAGAAGSPNSGYNILNHYNQRHYWITMRDGVKLFTTVYAPKVQTGSLPILLQRSLYNCWFKHVPPAFFAKAGYIFVYQDARGTCRSAGTFTPLSPPRDRRPQKSQVDESTDTGDTIRWLLAHVPQNNGKVGLWGGSYEGYYTQASIENSSPAIKAADIEAMGPWNYHQGVFMVADNFEFYINYKPKNGPNAPKFRYWTRDTYAFFLKGEPLSRLTSRYFNPESHPNPTWAEMLNHDSRDSFWRERDLLTEFKGIHCPVLNVGSWNDQYVPGGPPAYYHAIHKYDPGITDLLVMGPWSHVGDLNPDYEGRRLGNIDFDSDTARTYRQKILLPFFAHYLKGEPVKLPNVFVFDTGLDIWRTYAKWPPSGTVTRTLYLRSKEALSFDRPKAAKAYDQYISNPAKPVPIMAYVPNPDEAILPPGYLTADQRFAARRPDVLVYETKPLTGDVTVVGTIGPRLFVSTSSTDSDWDVKLIDVYPPDYPTPKGSRVDLGGYELLVRGEPMRGKFRHGWNKPEPFVPGHITKVSYTMPGVYHTFRKGHRIMIQIQSSMFPLADLNPQTFVNIPTAASQDFRKATERVYRGVNTDSRIIIHVLPQLAQRTGSGP
jgi:uncharacterized protein